ncbi:GSCOCG00011208001-RA-CDS, partial [Cotesia congregata]
VNSFGVIKIKNNSVVISGVKVLISSFVVGVVVLLISVSVVGALLVISGVTVLVDSSIADLIDVVSLTVDGLNVVTSSITPFKSVIVNSVGAACNIFFFFLIKIYHICFCLHE